MASVRALLVVALAAAHASVNVRASTMAAMMAGISTTGDLTYTGPSVCLTDPTTADCVVATLDLSLICSGDASMASSCTLSAQCNASITAGLATTMADSDANSTVCDPFVLLATFCTRDSAGGVSALASSTGACSSYSALCAAEGGANTTLCAQGAALQALPDTYVVNSMVSSICSTSMAMASTGMSMSMSMGATSSSFCSQCTFTSAAFPDCNLLGTYAQLCLTTPGMFQCAAYNTMCLAEPTLFLCSATLMGMTPAASAMAMYFKSGADFYLLFQNWVPSTPGTLCGAFFAIFLLAIVYEALTALQARLEKVWALAAAAPLLEEGQGPRYEDAFPWEEMCLFLPWTYAEISRMLLRFTVLCFQYLLMLAVMSFSVVIFFAVCSGLAIGTLFFHRFKTAAPVGAGGCLTHDHTNRPVPLIAEVDNPVSIAAAVWGIRALEVAAAVLVLVFAFQEHGGVPKFGQILDIHEWNFHAILMVFAFPIAMSEAFLNYRVPLLGTCTCGEQCMCNSVVQVISGVCGCEAVCRCRSGKPRQIIHVVLQTGTMVMAFVGLAAIIFYKSIPDPEDFNVESVEVYTVHAWVGILTLFFMAVQYFVGMIGLLVLTLWPNCMSLVNRQRLAYAHVFWAKAAFMGGVVSVAIGLMDMQMMELDNYTAMNAPGSPVAALSVPPPPNSPTAPPPADPGYYAYSAASIQSSVLGAIMLGITVAHLFLDSVYTSRKIKSNGGTCSASQASLVAPAPAMGDLNAKGEDEKGALGGNTCAVKKCCGGGKPTESQAVVGLAVTSTVAPAASSGWLMRQPLIRLVCGWNWNALLIRVFEATTVVLVCVFCIRDNGGLPNFGDHKNYNIWNWHVLLMVLAFPVVMSEAILAYRAPLFAGCRCEGECGKASGCPCGCAGQCTCSGQKTRRILHIALQTGVVVMAFLGLTAITWYKKTPPSDGEDPPPSGSAQMYSIHSYVGAITLFMLAGQYLVGVGAHTVMRNRMTPELRRTMAGWHAYFGKATFTGGIVSCMVGLMDIQMMQVDNGNFDQRSSASEELSFLGAIIFGLMLSHYWLDHVAILTPKSTVKVALKSVKAV